MNCTENSKINCPYNLDGIIFTSAKNQIYTKDRREHKFPTYKYKPPSHNSLDLYIEFERNKETGAYLEIFDNSLPDQIENQYFRMLNFFVGDSIGNKEVPVPFLPLEDNNIAFFPIDKGEIRDVEGNLVQDKTVVEVTYNNDPIVPHQYRWNILRTRWDKTDAIRRDGKKYGNFKDVAIKTWRAMREAVTIEEIRNLSDPNNYISQRNILATRVDKSVISEDRKQDKYYQKISNLGKEFRAFHNWFKSCLIYIHCGKHKLGKKGKLIKRDVLDFGCGRGGDFLKFYSARVKFYVGIDVMYEDLNSTTNGAIGRYNQHKKKYPDFTDMVFIQSDAAVPFSSKEQIKRFPNLSAKDKSNLDKIFTKDRKFDTITAMFSIHYLFRNNISVNNLIENVNNYLRKGGVLVCTLFNPTRIEKLLDGKKSYTSSYTDDEGKKKKLFEIVKKYDKLEDKPGLPIDVYMGWISEEDVYLEEYIVTEKLLSETMKKAGCVLVDHDSFSNVYHLNKPWFHNVIEYEENPLNRKFYQNVSKFFYDMKGPSKDTRTWSFLFDYYVYQKIE
jgi:SAM-dependent methyltransferase